MGDQRAQYKLVRVDLPSRLDRIIAWRSAARVAIWDASMLAWSVSGSDRAWGDPAELIRAFGDDWYSVFEENEAAL